MLKTINKKYFPKTYMFGPKWIVLGVNNVCNLHCKMCDVGTQSLESNFAQNLVGTRPINMPLSLITKVIDETAKYYPKSKLAYAFTEPLVYPHLIESLNYAKRKKVQTTITTNALTLKNKAALIANSNVSELYISLDGPQDIHNKIRGHNKSFQKAIEGIEILNESPIKPKIIVICAITEWNIGHLQELIKSLKHLDIAELAFMHTQFVTKEAVKLHEQTPWYTIYPATQSNIDLVNFNNIDIDTLLAEITAINRKDYSFKTYFSPNLSKKEDLELYYFNSVKPIGSSCDAVFSSMMIKSDGSTIPAHGRCYNINMGNIYEKSLKDIWQGTILKKLRLNLYKAGGLFPACSRCCSAF